MAKRKSKCKFVMAQAVERAIEPYRMERLERRVMLNGVSFDLPPETPAGPGYVTIADFNGDNNPDMAVAGGYNTVSVLLNNGNGTFATNSAYTTGSYPLSVTTGDFNGDGRPDLAVANSGGDTGNTVSVLLNNGDGTFATKVDYATGVNPYSVTAGDFNGDGKPDLAVANYGANSKSNSFSIGMSIRPPNHGC